MSDADVLIAGACPIGLTAAIELSRHGVACRIVDPLLEPRQYAKAVGVQPRTLEVFEGMGVLRRILDASTPMRGQIVYVNGARVGELELAVPADVPFGFVLIPQYETERVLAEELAWRGVAVERGVRLTAFRQDPDGVTATVTGLNGAETVRARYLVGADAETAPTVLPLIRDGDGDFGRMYSASGLSAYVVPPDGYLGLVASDVDAEDLAPRLFAHLRATFG